MEIKKVDVEDKEYPYRLLSLKDFPTTLYAVGNIDLLNAEHTIGIVGARKCTEYGIKATGEFSKRLAERNMCIISGLASGIDSIAHTMAIEEVGKTVAVLVSGFDYIYPTENEWLFNKILDKGGCVISEYPPEFKPDKARFPIRNRIISGLSDAILVVEAGHRSGSSITAKYARKEGKKVYAIPSSIYSSHGIGTNRLIKEGATLVTKPEEILEDMGFSVIKNKRKFVTSEKKQVQERIDNDAHSKKNINEIMSDEFLEVYRQLSEEPLHINELASKLKKSVFNVLPIITKMEIEGYVHQPQTNYFMKNVE